jgi:hypothetical protein
MRRSSPKDQTASKPGAVHSAFIGAATMPAHRKALTWLGVALTVPLLLIGALIVYLMIALSNGAHIG